MRLFAYCGATVTLRVDSVLTSANVPSERARYAKTCAVAPSAVRVSDTAAVIAALLVDDASVAGDTVTLAPVTA